MDRDKVFKKVISSEADFLGASILKSFLFGLSCIYSRIMEKRNKRYDSKNHKEELIYYPEIPVVSVGNITAGGTGKTPFVAYIAQHFIKRGIKPVVLTRGYGAKDNQQSKILSDGQTLYLTPIESGDEAYLLAKSLPQVAVIIGRSRVESAKIAINKLGAQVLILDDGFQHRKMGRHLDLVLLDSTNHFGYGYVLPRGLLREPLVGLQRASLIALTKTDQVSRERLKEIVDEIHDYTPHEDFIYSIHQPNQVIPLSVWQTGVKEEKMGIPTLVKDSSVLAVSAIGNPLSFVKTIEQAGYTVKDSMTYIDHYSYKVKDVQDMVAKAAELQVDAILITEKDAVKLGPIYMHEEYKSKIEFYVLPICIKITDNKYILDNALDTLVTSKKGSIKND